MSANSATRPSWPDGGHLREAARRRQDEDDAAVVLALLALLASRSDRRRPTDRVRTSWGSPAATLRSVGPRDAHAWWASGLLR